MSATPERSPAPLPQSVGDDAEALRALVSAMLGGSYREEFYLWDVASLCRSKPDFARQLLALIDRYQRLGQMSAAQHGHIRETIEQSLGPREMPANSAASSEVPGAEAAAAAAAAATTSVVAAEASALPDPTVTAPLSAAGTVPRSARRHGQAPYRQTSRWKALHWKAARREASRRHETARPPISAAPRTASSVATGRGTSPPAAAAPGLVSPPPAPAAPGPVLPALGDLGIAVPDPQDTTTPGPITIGLGSVLRQRYELQSLLGCGGMASVYSAVDRYRASLGLEDCRVALKLVTARPGHPEGMAALGREFHRAQLLSHPSVVNVYEIDHEGDASFYTMELLEGERLSQLSERIGGPLPQRQALAIIRDIGAAIAHAHSRGVVHADLKPHNIFVTFGGQVRVLDFGGLSPSPEAPWFAAAPPVDRPRGFRAATPAYASYEQLQGLRAEARDDTYALACIAYELLAGRHPFGGKSSLEARAQRLRPRRPRGLQPRPWRALRQGLAWERARRPQHLGAWLRQLGVTSAVHHLSPSHQLRAVVPPRAWPQPLAAALVLLGCLGAVAFSMSRQGGMQWHRTLAAAKVTLQDARRELQSTSATAAAPQTALPAAPPQAAVAATPSAAGVAAASGSPAGRTPSTSSHATGRRLRRLSVANASTVAGGPRTSATTEPGGLAPAIASTAAVTFTSPSYAVEEDAPAARLVVRRTGSSRDDLRFVWWTVDDSAKADVDYATLGRRVERIPRGENNVTIYVPIISNPLRHQTATFYVAIASPSATDTEAPSARASVTIERGG